MIFFFFLKTHVVIEQSMVGGPRRAGGRYDSYSRQDETPRRQYRSRSRSGEREDERERSRSPHGNGRSGRPPRGGDDGNSIDSYNSPEKTRRRPRSPDEEPKDRLRRGKSESSEEERGRRPTRDETASNGDEDEMMRQMMGFSSFDTTKEKKVVGKNVGGVAKVKPSGFRQYMNRSGGFNRELSPPPTERKR